MRPGTEPGCDEREIGLALGDSGACHKRHSRVTKLSEARQHLVSAGGYSAGGTRVRHSSDMNLDSVADDLYGLSLEEFTVTRNERAKQARAAGDRQLADQIRSLSKPTQAAWLVNQLVRRHADEVELLLELGRELRDVLADVEGDELRELTQQRYRLVSGLVEQTRSLAQGGGRRVTDDVAQAVRTTLEATLSDESSADALAAGRLTKTLDVSSWFGVSDEEVDPRRKPRESSEPPAGTVADLDAQRQRRARQQAAQQVEAAQQHAERSRLTAERAAEHLRSAQQRSQDASATVDRLRQELEDAVATLQQLEEQEQAASRDSEQAHLRTDEADDELADAQAQLSDLGS